MQGPDEPYVVNFPTLGFLVADWIEWHCPIPDREHRGQPFELYDWQLWCTVNHYRVRTRAKRGQLAPAFHYRRSQIVGPQKSGKGPWAAAIILAEGLGPVVFDGWARDGQTYDCADHNCGCGFVYTYERGEPMGKPWTTPLIQLTATAEEQTDNVYRPLQSMVKLGPLSDLVKVGEEFTRLPNDGRIDVVTSSARARLGNPITFALQDETGLYTKQNKLVSVAETQRRGAAGMGGRTMETTNAWDPAEQSVAQRTAESLRPDIFRFHRDPPAHLSYRNKDERAKIHRHVYKGSGHVDLNGIEAEAAELLEKDPAQAERFFGNRVKATGDSYFDGDKWDDNAFPMPVASGEPIVIGFDGSDADVRGHADETWFRCVRMSDGYMFTPRFPDGRPMRWKHPEDLEQSKRWQVPRGEVHAAKRHLFSTYRVLRMYADPPYWQSEIDEWAAENPDVVVRWETYRTRQMSAALEQLRTDINAGDLLHDGDPEVAEHIRNAKGSPRAGGTLIVKKSEEQKIDADMASALAYEAYNDQKAAGDADPEDNSFTAY